MNPWKRLKNLWRLSGETGFYPLPEDFPKKTPFSFFKESGTFIPYEPISPIKKITEEHAEH